MSTPDQSRARKRLPVNPSIENLKKQAKRLAKRQPTLSLQQAQHRLAVEYGCANWSELSHVVETMGRGASQSSNVKYEMEPLPAAANRRDIETVRAILASGEFTQHDLDLALARCVLRFDQRGDIARLLVEHGADPDGQYGSNYGPIVFVTGETLDPEGLQFLIDAGADVTFAPLDTKYGSQCPMSYVLGSYVRGRNEQKHRMIGMLLKASAHVPVEVTPEQMAIHRGDALELARLLDGDPSLLSRRYPSMPYGNMQLRGATLLHLAVEFSEIECLDLLLDRGADINLPAGVIDGIGGQTPVFHAIATNQGAGIQTLEHLRQREAKKIDMSVRATFRRYDEVQATPVGPLEYAERASAADVPDWRRAGEREIKLLRSLAR